jgi:hypothetical protein
LHFIVAVVCNAQSQISVLSRENIASVLGYGPSPSQLNSYIKCVLVGKWVSEWVRLSTRNDIFNVPSMKLRP